MDALEYINKNQLPDDVILSKNNQSSGNQGKDSLKDSTTNQEPEKDIHKDVEDSNNPDDKVSEKKFYKMMQLLTKVIITQIMHKTHQMIQTKIQRITKIK